MKKAIVLVLMFGFVNSINAQDKICCNSAACKAEAGNYAVKVTEIVTLLGNCSGVKETDNTVLAAFRSQRPEVYSQLVSMVKELNKMFFTVEDEPMYIDSDCFSDQLPTIAKSNVMCWVNHIRKNVLKEKAPFPSTEFCFGWKRRIELAQGAESFLSKSKMQYLGSLRGYLIYTFKGKNACGGSFRLMAGPALFLRSSDSYFALTSRLSVRLLDLNASVFHLGNLNFAGGYNTNFNGFNLAEAGLEVELGPLGLNLLGNYNVENKRPGFLIGIILANKKL